jgi:nitroreductase
MRKETPTDHPVHDLIAARWSPRAFAPETVPAESLRSILEAARWAASCFNEQPWSFIVARREDESEFEKMLDCLMEGNRGWAKNAGALILAVARSSFSRNDKPNRHAWHDVGQAAANLSLQATALGLVVHQMAGISPDKAREVYAIPEGYEVVTAIAVGKAGDPGSLPDPLREMENAPRQRRPQAEFVFGGSWGTNADW